MDYTKHDYKLCHRRLRLYNGAALANDERRMHRFFSSAVLAGDQIFVAAYRAANTHLVGGKPWVSLMIPARHWKQFFGNEGRRV